MTCILQPGRPPGFFDDFTRVFACVKVLLRVDVAAYRVILWEFS